MSATGDLAIGHPDRASAHELPDDTFVPTVLFVDDEPEVLNGLRVSLRRERHSYRFLFATGADDAISIMEREPVDMVVSDMRMPDRNGADLLEEVRFRFPDVVRYVLSGQAEDRLVRRSVAVTHRWLTKPCSREALIEALEEAVGFRGRVDDPAVRRAIGAVDALPSHPEAYDALVGALARPEVTIDEVVGLAAADPALTAKLLQWANLVFTEGVAVYDVRRAIERIGLDVLTHLSTADDVVRRGVAAEVIPGFGIDLFHRYARQVAHVAAGLATPERADLAAAAGLLSGTGLLLEVSHLREPLERAYRLALTDRVCLVSMEQDLFGRSHPELAGHLLSLWGLPRDLVAAVAASHRRPDPSAVLPMSPETAVQAARLLVQRTDLSRAVGLPHLAPIDDELAAALDRWSGELEDRAAR
jgi:HD-like signal output (HDOD) protein/CheY-like chemotaxis protein